MWDSLTNDSCDVCQCPARTKARSMDKENQLSPAKVEELSFYGNPTPAAPTCTSPTHCTHSLVTRRPLEDYDHNSRDSGYLTTYSDSSNKFSNASPNRSCFESFGSMEDDFFENFADFEPLSDELPQDFSKLLSAPLNGGRGSPKDVISRPLFRRALSMQNETTPPSRARASLFKVSNMPERPFKRPEPPLGPEGAALKRARLTADEEELIAAVLELPRPPLQRAVSSTEESIMSAVQRSSTEPDLIGDFSKTFCLPLTPGRHQDLKSITSATLAQLIQGEFVENIANFKVIDCRYPYEFEGGHIGGALNLYTKEQCVELLKNMEMGNDQTKRNILVFHCEFSSERGPNLYRFLRKQDRQMNEESYPTLNYPEIYLLEGGYKHFFEHFSNLCVPISYKEMLHPEHENDLKYFRQKSKTWNVDTRQRRYKTNFKRLGM